MKNAFFVALFTLTAVATSAVPRARPMPPIDPLSLGAHAGAIISAGFEIAEDIGEVGHGHGVAVLCASRLCREINCLREAGMEQMEDMLGEEAKIGFSSKVVGVLTSRAVIVTLAMGALAAASLEVIEDSKPGGHHGAVLLAVYELMELLEQSGTVTGRFLGLIQNHLVRVSLSLGAASVALAETVKSFEGGKIGAHHGVLLLALSKLLYVVNIMRTNIKEKED